MFILIMSIDIAVWLGAEPAQTVQEPTCVGGMFAVLPPGYIGVEGRPEDGDIRLRWKVDRKALKHT